MDQQLIQSSCKRCKKSFPIKSFARHAEYNAECKQAYSPQEIEDLKKEINDRIVGVVMTKFASPPNVFEAKFIGKISINVIYSFWIAIILANQATKVTE